MRKHTHERWVFACFGALMLSVGCGGDIDEDLDSIDQSLSIADADHDGIPDSLEDQLALKFAPVVKLAPSEKDWTRPANIDWYLKRVHMRFDHSGARDCEILPVGKVTQDNLRWQSHPRGKAWYGRHSGSLAYSADSEKQFFLQPPDDRTHSGAAPTEWRVYVHVRSSTVVTAGYDIQYWFFYPYNDYWGPINHEADWEHVTVSLDTQQRLHSVFYSQHEGGSHYEPSQLQWINQTHPVVYSADGSHANYPEAGRWSVTWRLRDNTYDGGPVWYSASNLVNVGELRAPRNGQTFIQYGGRWGEIGEIDGTSGPQGPAFQSAWQRE